MPFIGQSPVTGAYHKLDSITTSATATYNLLLNGGAYYPASANNLLVSLNGVMQAPQDSFTVSGSQITFASALTSSDVIDFIMALGDVLNIGTPSDGSVNTTQLANSAVTDAKMASTLDLSGKTMTYGNLPAGNLTGTVSNARFPTGTVISTSSMATFDATINADQTLMTITVTPQSSSSKFLCIGRGATERLNGTSGNYCFVRFNRDGTNITGGQWGNAVNYQINNNARAHFSGIYLDSPATTSNVTYTVSAYDINGAGGGGSVNWAFYQMTFVVLEIA